MTFFTRFMVAFKKILNNKGIKTPSFQILFYFILFSSFITSCRSIPDKPWTSLIPGYVPAVVIPNPNTTIKDALNSEYMPFFDDITSSAIPLIEQVEKVPKHDLDVKAMIMYPDLSTDWQPVWITTAPKDYIKHLDTYFHEPFTTNHYHFDDVEIYKYHVDQRLVYAAEIKQWSIFSESSMGIEACIRAYMGHIPALDIKHIQVKPGTLILNGGHLDSWVSQQSAVRFRPLILNAFAGMEPADLSVGYYGKDSNKNLEISGSIPLDSAGHSNLTKALSSMNAPMTLDRYIPSDAAAFAILHEPVQDPIISDSLQLVSALDSSLVTNPAEIKDLDTNIRPEFSYVTFDPGGYLSIGENLFIRKLNDPDAFLHKIDSFVTKGLIKKEGDGYFVHSPVLAKIIGSPLCSYETFYLSVTGNVAVISPRLGLTDRVKSDHNRNRVFYYSEDFTKIKKDLPKRSSAVFFARSKHLYRYLKSYLSPNNYVSAVTSKFDLLAASMQLGENGKEMTFHLKTYKSQNSNLPFREKWVFPLNGGDLTGTPVLADIGGSSRDEILFATTNGNIYALASDGTILTQMNTGDDTPIGSPIVYDWYGNNQSAIMIAAGNKIYAWNAHGDLLPKFPVKLEEQVTAPLTIGDVTRDGLPKMIVATADHKLHVLNGRGLDIGGWPVSTNANIKNQPILQEFDGQWSVWATAENGLFAWNKNGTLRKGFPVFISASFSTHPVFDDNNAFITSADGYLYTLGKNRILTDSLNTYRHTSYDSLGNGLHLGALYVSNTALNGTPSIQDVNVRLDSTTVQKEHLILLQSSNGSEFLYTLNGALRFTENMGQPTATGEAPFVSDLRNDNNPDVVSVSNYGRLYAWDILTGERMYDLPTSAMKYPIVTDLDGDGNMELIANTQDGLVCWTLTKKSEMTGSDSAKSGQ